MSCFARPDRVLLAAAVLFAPLLAAAGDAEAGKKVQARVEVVSLPATAAGIDSLGTPIGGIVDLADGLPPGATDSDDFPVPAGQQLILDQVGAFASFDRELPAGARFPLFLSGSGFQMPIGFGEAIGNEIHFAIPLSMVVEGSLRFAILGSFGGAEVQFARYSFTGRLVPAPAE